MDGPVIVAGLMARPRSSAASVENGVKVACTRTLPNLRKDDTDGQDGVANFTGAKTAPNFKVPHETA